MSDQRDLEARFDRAAEILLGELAGTEALSLDFAGEVSVFMRFTGSKVRQIGEVDIAQAQFKYYRDGKTLSSSVTLGGEAGRDEALLVEALSSARREAALLPEDPYQTLPVSSESSRESYPGRLPDEARLPEEILAPATVLEGAGADYVGLHSQGLMCRGAATSSGSRHWFSTETFTTDYSAFLPNGKAVKSSYAGREWSSADYESRLKAELPRLKALAKPERVLAPGGYRVWISPEAMKPLMSFFSWYGLSERELREGESAWMALRDGSRPLSGKLSLSQDFSLGLMPRFNELGELAPERLELITEGRLKNAFVSARTARQYGIRSNAASEDESLRSGVLAAGDLPEDRVLESLGTGLYISNLHYLNWSDVNSARVTGMTRFACLWVEGGKIVAPIKDMRFDESLYKLWGDKLLAVGAQRSLIVDRGSYLFRDLGGSLLPGMLVEDFSFTL